MYYVYLLLDPRKNNQPFYVGKGTKDRWKDHLNETIHNTINKRKFNTIECIKKNSLEVGVKFMAEFEDESLAYEYETKLIQMYGRKGYEQDGILTNICIDSRPPRWWELPDAAEIIENTKKTRAENPYHHTQEIKDKISSQLKGKRKPPRSKEHLAALSVALKGKPLTRECSDETKRKRSINQLGKKASDETKRKISQKLKGRVLTEEHKEKIRQKMLSRKQSQ